MRLGTIMTIKAGLFAAMAVALVIAPVRAEKFMVPEGYRISVETIGDETVESFIPIADDASALAEIAPAAGPGMAPADDQFMGARQKTAGSNAWVLFEYE